MTAHNNAELIPEKVPHPAACLSYGCSASRAFSVSAFRMHSDAFTGPVSCLPPYSRLLSIGGLTPVAYTQQTATA
ncbi:MAG: hypothetical protein AB2784_22225 [Candidatus Thiodiazotropha endolucinida]